MQSHYTQPPSLIVTSIAAPNAVMKELASQCKSRNFTFYVIGDVPSPKDFQLDGCEFFSLERQKATGFQTAELLPLRHYARKNIGYLLAMRNRAGLILETDDDNMPAQEFWRARQVQQRARTLSRNGWTNVYAYFSEVNIWPRGLPLDAVQATLPGYESLKEVEAECPIQQGLADENPDVDAIYRLVLPLPVSFRKDRRIGLGSGTWCPFNSQNTAWFPTAYPLLYLPSYCSFRMTDIWRSFVAQRISWENGWNVLFSPADVWQERNEHNLMRDFADEVPGYLHNRAIGERLERLSLSSGVENIPDNLVLCYEELVKMGVVDSEEIALVEAWIKDLAAVHGSSASARG
jgi:STELLO glycosyltransferase-like protein